MASRCCDTPHIARLQLIQENRKTDSPAGSFPTLPREEMTEVVAPTFEVPSNPLLPPGYNETLDYASIQYLNGFYRTQIGRYVRIEQQINSADIETRYGFLIGVGINYLLLQDASTGNVYAIDSYSIKLFYVYYNEENPFPHPQFGDQSRSDTY